VYASYLGGSQGADAATAIAVDGSGNAYLEGYAYSVDFPTTNGAFQQALPHVATEVDAFVAKFNPALSGAASLVYSTLLGGTTTATGVYPYGSGYVPDINLGAGTPQIAGGIAVDSSGDAYVTSATTQTNFPTTPGAYQTKSNIVGANPTTTVVESDVFVTKLNASGSALVYSTYLGGGGSKKTGGTRSGGASIAVDANGDAHVTGWTNSTTFPTVNALQTKNGGGFDAFVTVLNPTGSGLLFSGFFGGGGNDYGYGIALDSAGNAYVGGQTGSSNFPTTVGAYQTTPGSGFALKIDPPADLSEVSVPILSGSSDLAAEGATLSEPRPASLFGTNFSGLALDSGRNLLNAPASRPPSGDVSAKASSFVHSPPTVIATIGTHDHGVPQAGALPGGSEDTVDQLFSNWQFEETNWLES
jgi:hypothetical protein